MAKANAEHIETYGGGDFFRFVAQGYITQVAMTIRRHSKDDDTISFMRVLKQVKTCAPQFTYEVYLQQHPIEPDYAEWQKPTFAQFSEDGRLVSETKVDADIVLLKKLTANVVELCDKEFAHVDKRGYSGTVTFGEVEACVNAFDKLVCKYFKDYPKHDWVFNTRSNHSYRLEKDVHRADGHKELYLERLSTTRRILMATEASRSGTARKAHILAELGPLLRWNGGERI
jgi:hypothetical protein